LSEGVDGQELTDRITHLRLFVRWIGKYALLDELKIYAVGAGAGDSSARTGHLASGIDIPLLTREKVMETLYEQRGDLRKTARALTAGAFHPAVTSSTLIRHLRHISIAF
jgi:hypothetical protein